MVGEKTAKNFRWLLFCRTLYTVYERHTQRHTGRHRHKWLSLIQWATSLF